MESSESSDVETFGTGFLPPCEVVSDLFDSVTVFPELFDHLRVQVGEGGEELFSGHLGAVHARIVPHFEALSSLENDLPAPFFAPNPLWNKDLRISGRADCHNGSQLLYHHSKPRASMSFLNSAMRPGRRAISLSFRPSILRSSSVASCQIAQFRALYRLPSVTQYSVLAT